MTIATTPKIATRTGQDAPIASSIGGSDPRASVVDSEAVKSLRERRIAETLPLYRGIMRRALDGTGGRANAIKAFCLHCTGDLRDQVTNCTAPACPLFAYRPYQPGQSEDEER